MADNHRDTDRAEYFSDAVIAIAATLLASELPIPKTSTLAQDGETTSFVASLFSHWPSYAGFMASFLFIGIAWANHHDMFRYIKRTDHIFLILNLFFLMGISLYSFSTAIVVDHIGKSTQREAAIFYNAILVVTTLVYNAMWWYAMKKGLLDDNTDKQMQKELSIEYAIVPLLHIVTLVVAIWSVPWSLLPLFSTYIAFALPRVSERHSKEDHAENISN
jgi:uncharacterized membrane protein